MIRYVIWSYDVTIDPLIESDLDDVVRIERDSFSVPWTRKMFHDELAGNPFASLFVSREGGTIVGYACYWVIFEELHIMNLAVSPSHHRRGIASAMMTHAIAHACACGVHEAMLEVRASNVPAIAFYTQFGFQKIALRERYYSNPVEDAMILRRRSLDTVNATHSIDDQKALHMTKAVSG